MTYALCHLELFYKNMELQIVKRGNEGNDYLINLQRKPWMRLLNPSSKIIKHSFDLFPLNLNLLGKWDCSLSHQTISSCFRERSSSISDFTLSFIYHKKTLWFATWHVTLLVNWKPPLKTSGKTTLHWKEKTL